MDVWYRYFTVTLKVFILDANFFFLLCCHKINAYIPGAESMFNVEPISMK